MIVSLEATYLICIEEGVAMITFPIKTTHMIPMKNSKLADFKK